MVYSVMTPRGEWGPKDLDITEHTQKQTISIRLEVDQYMTTSKQKATSFGSPSLRIHTGTVVPSATLLLTQEGDVGEIIS